MILEIIAGKVKNALRTVNSKGTVFYGMHFYPGLAEYRDETGAQRVYLNENTIRKMDASFSGRPVFVQHVEGVNDNLDELRGEADGWVVESFYNEADGKHWVKFIVVSERGLNAIKAGMRLSNCYLPTGYASGGMYSGMDYDKEITGGEYEHLAIVDNPRYEESVVMTTEEFRRYNSEQRASFERLANERTPEMKLFKRQAIENAKDLEGLEVTLTKSSRTVPLSVLFNEADERELAKGKEAVVDLKAVITFKNEKMTVGDLVERHNKMCDEMDEMKKRNVSFTVDEDTAGEADHELENADEDEEDDEKKKKKDNKAAKKNAKDEPPVNDDLGEDSFESGVSDRDVKAAAKERAERLRNAKNRADIEEASAVEVDFSDSQVALGRARYGS